MTVGEYLDKWLRHIKPTIRPSTYHWYEDIVRLHLKPSLGSIPLAKLMPLHLQEYYLKAQSSGHLDSSGNPTGDKLSNASVRAHHRTLHRALGRAVKLGHVPRNVADLADPPAVVKTEKPTLTFEQGRQLLEAAKSTGRYALYLMALTTGMRQGEILGLRWKDVDLDARVITVRQALKRGGSAPVFSPPKTKRSARRVEIPEALAQALRSHKARQNEAKLLNGPSYNQQDLVFCSEAGTPITPRNLVRQFKQLLKKAGLHDIRFHDLRHTHATWMLEEGINSKIVADRLGHSSTTVTLDVYSHVTPATQREASERVNARLLGSQ